MCIALDFGVNLVYMQKNELGLLEIATRIATIPNIDYAK